LKRIARNVRDPNGTGLTGRLKRWDDRQLELIGCSQTHSVLSEIHFANCAAEPMRL
jgi:hypothetical protein